MTTPVTKSFKTKIIDSLWVFIIATAFLGPLALPLLWRNPRYKKSTKVIASIVVCLLTALLIWVAKVYLEPFIQEFKVLLEQSPTP